MRTNFYDILSSHSRAYPKMMAEDYYTLAYESEYGEVFDGDNDAQVLLDELNKTKTDVLEPFTVTIGGGYARLNLAPIKAYLSADNILSLMSLTPKEGSSDGLDRKISLIRRSSVMGILPQNARDVDKCEGSVTHSAPYKRLYGASYRIISSDISPVIPGLCLISEALGKAEKVIVALDGRKASGKSFACKVISTVFASEIETGKLVINDGFGSFGSGNYDIKLYFDTDEDSRRMRIIEAGGDVAWVKYESDTRPEEDAYIEKYEPAINCDLVIRT
ncbi:MAG: hypothetical protein E7648_07275 [Ruminococcaceae bacterium]|nr:hypothetical protein [Oscillospiraceae bacterium]